MKADRALINQINKGCLVIANYLLQSPSIFFFDFCRRYPVGEIIRHFFLVESFFTDTVGKTSKGQGTVFYKRQEGARNFIIILNQIAFGYPCFREVYFFPIFYIDGIWTKLHNVMFD